MPIGVLVLRTRNEPLWHLPWSRCHSYIRLRRVLLLRSGIRLSPSDIRYASLGGEYNITATTELQSNSEQYHCCLQQYHADTVSISLPIRYGICVYKCSNRHLPVSENAVLCFIIFLYPLYKLFVYLFTVARCSLSPLVVSGT